MVMDWSGAVVDEFGLSGVDAEAAASWSTPMATIVGSGTGAQLGDEVLAVLAAIERARLRQGGATWQTVGHRCPEMKAVRMPQDRYDVAILGGGLAGLSLAQPAQAGAPADEGDWSPTSAPSRPPEAAFKVGESSVEIGATTTATSCRDGRPPRRAAAAQARAALLPARRRQQRHHQARGVLHAADRLRTVYTHQIDRGVFENELFDRALERGADAYRGWRVDGRGARYPTASTRSRSATRGARGTSRRAGWWTPPGATTCCAASSASAPRQAITSTPAGFASRAGWTSRTGPTTRSGSAAALGAGRAQDATTHLCGQGYWVWLIRLATGPISIGVVLRPSLSPVRADQRVRRGCSSGCRQHEPQLAQSARGPPRRGAGLPRDRGLLLRLHAGVLDGPLDARRARRPAFIDPLYSPGSDFIAYLNSFGGDLICRDLDGEDIEERLDFFNFFFVQLFDADAVAVPRPVPVLRQRAGDDGQAAVRQHRLLLDARVPVPARQDDPARRTSATWSTCSTRSSRCSSACRTCTATGTRSTSGSSRACRCSRPVRRRSSRPSTTWASRSSQRRWSSRAKEKVEVLKAIGGVDVPHGRQAPARAARSRAPDQPARGQPATRQVGGGGAVRRARTA